MHLSGVSSKIFQFLFCNIGIGIKSHGKLKLASLDEMFFFSVSKGQSYEM